MRQIKNLGIKTKEGFEVKNLQRFPSMEWGEEGGMQAELYLNGKHIMNVFQEGNGGCASAYWTDYGKTIEEEVKEKAYNALLRIDKDFGPNSQFEWLRDKTPAKMDDDDFESLVNRIEERYDDVKMAKKFFKKGSIGCALIDFGWKGTYVGLNSLNEELVKRAIDKSGKYNDYKSIKIYTPTNISDMI